MRLVGSRPWDVALACACAGALFVNGYPWSRGGGVVLAGALSVVTCGPLIWRGRAPVVALLAVAGGLLACLAVFRPVDAAIPVAMLALYTVGVRGDRRRSLVVGLGSAVVLVAVIADLETDGELLPGGALRLTLVLSALVVGDTVRSRRALSAAAAEQARRDVRDRENESRRRMDDERLRIARELHDTIAHALVAINVRAGVAAHLGADSQEAEALVEIKDVSAGALRDLRSTLDVLREQDGGPPIRPAQDLDDLPELLERAQASGLDAHADVRLDGMSLASPVGQAGFRIVQESLTNVLRHANATRAEVEILASEGMLHIRVVDDGRPGVVAASQAGHGLLGMAERAGALGGHVDAGPAPAGGWRVHAELPLTSTG